MGRGGGRGRKTRRTIYCFINKSEHSILFHFEEKDFPGTISIHIASMEEEWEVKRGGGEANVEEDGDEAGGAQRGDEEAGGQDEWGRTYREKHEK